MKKAQAKMTVEVSRVDGENLESLSQTQQDYARKTLVSEFASDGSFAASILTKEGEEVDVLYTLKDISFTDK